MIKIPFHTKYRKQIETGEYQVMTRSGMPVKIVQWGTKDGFYPIIALYENSDGVKNYGTFAEDGRFVIGEDNDCDLFIITNVPETTEEAIALLNSTVAKINACLGYDKAEPDVPCESKPKEKPASSDSDISESDMTSFEYVMLRYLQDGVNAENDAEIERITKRYSEQLLAAAQTQLKKDGYLVEKMFSGSEDVQGENQSEFEDTLQKIIAYFANTTVDNQTIHDLSDDLMDVARKEMFQADVDAIGDSSDPYFIYYKGILRGKSEAMKETPQWKKPNCRVALKLSNMKNTLLLNETQQVCLAHNGYIIPVADLEKLPGYGGKKGSGA